ncbi:MAG: G:T/U mismatch-specific uracil/thymine DNA-glycosylase [uncultured Sulfurovum sp.]|uniref:G:T/U mismatch-specific uracil/thymine DNA-glycosylase n=1 Tax=uncultured Sulfurovum sp. TaxID=269237 RepID=A0A6S6TV93_9BACT|nr:MAG: G:T/U mismatch-specific uracil/thymine DNA-glycosylase [uncultured Sulfurovum sp.]
MVVVKGLFNLMTREEESFQPIIFKNSEILILGSFPSLESFEKSFYYAHPRNQFWKLLSALTASPINNRDQKIWLLKESKIALWDMVKSCTRENSLDSSLEEIEVNDLASFLEEHPSIKKVAFTGRLSEKLFKMHFGYLEIETVYLPSPSAAYAKMSFEIKLENYKRLLVV